ncbi:MAG: hypothetical protein DSY60_01045 [Persephonella sp.]|nr:MAG: hypothetical protein DSY60_01045 [Persephonella sp.]
MKKLVLGLSAVALSAGMVMAGPADTATTVIEKSKISNKSSIEGSRITNVGIDQKNTINSIKIRKGVKVNNSKIENKAKMKGSQVLNVGIGQDNTIGSVDIGDNASPKATSGSIRYRGR